MDILNKIDVFLVSETKEQERKKAMKDKWNARYKEGKDTPQEKERRRKEAGKKWNEKHLSEDCGEDHTEEEEE